MGTQLATLDPGDHATWAGVARETAGVFAAWSLRTECVPGPLADASDQLARSAAVHARTVTQRPGRPVSLRGPAFLLMQLAANPSSRTGQALLIRQLGNTLRAIHQAQAATAQARQGQQLVELVRERLVQVAAALPDEPPRRPLNAQEAAQPNRTPLIGRPYDHPVPGTLGAAAATRLQHDRTVLRSGRPSTASSARATARGDVNGHPG